MNFHLKENDKENGSQIILTKTNEIVATNQRTNWEVSPNSKVNSKVALRIFHSLQHSHDLSWGSGKKLTDFLNSDEKIIPKLYASTNLDDQTLSYSEGTDTLRTSPGNNMIAYKKDDLWCFDTRPSTPDRIGKKLFLIAHKTDFSLSGEEMMDAYNNGLKKEHKNEDTGISISI